MKVSGIKSAYVQKQSMRFPVVLLLVSQPQRNAKTHGQSLAYLTGLGRRVRGLEGGLRVGKGWEKERGDKVTR